MLGELFPGLLSTLRLLLPSSGEGGGQGEEGPSWVDWKELESTTSVSFCWILRLVLRNTAETGTTESVKEARRQLGEVEEKVEEEGGRGRRRKEEEKGREQQVMLSGMPAGREVWDGGPLDDVGIGLR